MNDKSVKILIGGDFVPTLSNKDLFDNEDIVGLLGQDCVDLFTSSDFSITNLESPLSDSESPISKWGPNLIAPTSSVKLIKKLGLNLVGLSNNHILDQGSKGLQCTIKALDGAGISHVGAGNNIGEAKKVFVSNIKNKKIAVYVCSEHEFNTATIDTAGANPFDPLESLDHIKDGKNKADYLVVLFHGGLEFYRYPSPRIKKVCHKMIDAGADLVIVQHTHCVGCHEKYNGGEIIYGQGNFLFDRGDDEFWKTGLLVLVELGEANKVSFIPLEKNKEKVRISDDKEILCQFEERSKVVYNDQLIFKMYSDMSEERLNTYLLRIGGRRTNNLLFRGVNKLFRNCLIRKTYSEKDLLCLIDYLRCEAHNELIDAGCMKRHLSKKSMCFRAIKEEM